MDPTGVIQEYIREQAFLSSSKSGNWHQRPAELGQLCTPRGLPGVFGGQNLGSIWVPRAKKWLFLASIWLYLGSFWVRFFTIINNDGQSLGSFFQKHFFLRLAAHGK
jgi:hypothetical protein